MLVFSCETVVSAGHYLEIASFPMVAVMRTSKSTVQATLFRNRRGPYCAPRGTQVLAQCFLKRRRETAGDAFRGDGIDYRPGIMAGNLEA